MERFKTILAPLCIVTNLGLFGQQLEWFSSYGSPLENAETGELQIVPSSNGGLFGVGRAGGTTWDLDGQMVSVTGDSDVLLFRLNAQGEAQWAHTAGGDCEDPDPWDDRPRQALRDLSSGNLVVTGNYSGNASFGTFQLPGTCGNQNMFVAAYSEDGTALWASRAVGNLFADAILMGPDDNVHLFGIVNEVGATFFGSPNVNVLAGGFHATYANDGTLVDAEHLLNTGEVFGAIRYGSDMVLCGSFVNADTLWGTPLASDAPFASGFLCRSNGLGSIAWTVICGSSSQASFVDCVELTNGDIAVAGYFVADVYIGEDTLYTSPTPPGDRFIARFSPTGDLRWLKLVSSPDFFSIHSLVSANDGGFYLNGSLRDSLSIGNSTLPCTTSLDQYVAQVDSAGEWVGALFLGRDTFSGPVGLCVNNDGIFVSGAFDSTMVIGSEVFEPTHMLWPDLFVAKFDGLGPVSIIQPFGLPDDQLRIYANPNNGICTIDLPSSISPGSDLVLTIFDASGREVQRVPLLISNGTVQLDIQAQAKGLYHVELQDGQHRYSGTIVFE